MAAKEYLQNKANMTLPGWRQSEVCLSRKGIGQLHDAWHFLAKASPGTTIGRSAVEMVTFLTMAAMR